MASPTWPSLLLVSFALLLAFFTPSSSATPQDLHKCLSDAGLTNVTAFSNSSAYESLLGFALQNLRYAKPRVPKPELIILPAKPQHVQGVVRCCVKYGFQMRIRSGGHSYEAHSSWSQVEPFVLIDLMQLQNVHVDIANETAWIEGGATLGQMYSAIANASSVHGFPAGTCPTVGAAGQLSGGGYGMMTRMYGIAADHVEDALLVDAKGDLLNRKAMGEDVFWALRGGGGGTWGVVVAWKIKLVRVPSVVTVFDINRTDDAENIMYKWQMFAPFTDDRLTMRADLKGHSTHRMANLYALFLGNKSDLLRLTDEGLPELALKDEECSEMSYFDSVNFFAREFVVTTLVDRYNALKSTFKATSDLTVKSIPKSGLVGLWDRLGVKNGSDVLFTPLGGAMNRTSSTATPFPYRRGYLTLMHYGLFWEDDHDNSTTSNRYDDVRVRYVRNVRKYLRPYVSSNPRGAYVNYLDLDLGDARGRNGLASVEEGKRWGVQYFGEENYMRLVKAKTQIDPTNVFRHPQSIPPATS